MVAVHARPSRLVLGGASTDERSLGGRDCHDCAPAFFQCVREAASTVGGRAHAIHRPHVAIHIGGGVLRRTAFGPAFDGLRDGLGVDWILFVLAQPRGLVKLKSNRSNLSQRSGQKFCRRDDFSGENIFDLMSARGAMGDHQSLWMSTEVGAK